MKRKIKSITIIGRRWFRKSAGNSYCSATILVNGIAAGRVHNVSGYGSYYEQVSWEQLESLGLITDRIKHANGSSEPPWQYCERKKIDYYHEAIDVAREKDLCVS